MAINPKALFEINLSKLPNPQELSKQLGEVAESYHNLAELCDRLSNVLDRGIKAIKNKDLK